MSKNSEYVITCIKKRKKDLRSVFHSKCCLCGFNEVQEALDFHHVNPEEKKFGIGDASAVTTALEKQLEEIRKCVLLCANCHRGVHSGEYKIPDNWKEYYDEEVAQKLLENLNKIKHREIRYCKICKKEITSRATYCEACAKFVSRKVERPSREILKQEIRTISFVELGRKYNVTDNAIRKWCDEYNLPRRKTDISQYTDDQWEKI